jgi:hypothetical protein
MIGLEKQRLLKAIENDEYKRELLKEVYTKSLLTAINSDDKIKKQIIKFIKNL